MAKEEVSGYCGIGLFAPQKGENVGGALRAAYCFNAAFIVTSGGKYATTPTDVFQTVKHIPFFRVKDLRMAIPQDCVPVAVELTAEAEDIRDYHHPARAFYIFGPENGSLGKDVLSYCRDIIRIPTLGCLNLAMAVNIVLYDRIVKMHDKRIGEQ